MAIESETMAKNDGVWENLERHLSNCLSKSTKKNKARRSRKVLAPFAGVSVPSGDSGRFLDDFSAILFRRCLVCFLWFFHGVSAPFGLKFYLDDARFSGLRWWSVLCLPVTLRCLVFLVRPESFPLGLLVCRPFTVSAFPIFPWAASISINGEEEEESSSPGCCEEIDMNCLPCFNKDKDDDPASDKTTEPTLEELTASSNAQSFNFRELAMATKNFRQECLLGEGGFGRVFKGTLQSTDQVVAVKQLDRSGTQENKEFTVEVLKLSLLNHPNLVNLIGYCADGDQRLLVYEYMPMGNLEQHLYGDDPDRKPLDWATRMKIANGVASGLEYLHEKANPPVAYRDLKPSNVLLDDNLEPKLSDFGMFKLGAGGGGDPSGTSRVMGTYGYSAPEYSQGGEFTLKSDVYSFCVVVLELITGRRAIDTTRPR